MDQRIAAQNSRTDHDNVGNDSDRSIYHKYYMAAASEKTGRSLGA